MKQSVLLLALVVIGVLAYTLYGMIAFVPDPTPPFVFNEPILPPEIAKEFEEAKMTILSGTELSKKNMAIGNVQKAARIYQQFAEGASPQVAETFAILNDRFLNWQMPSYLLSGSLDATNKRTFELLSVDNANFTKVENDRHTLSCATKTPPSNILIGTDADDTIDCSDMTSTDDRIFLGGPGNDTITDAHGKRIINGGSGDDSITVGQGRTILVLDDSWGKDQVSIDCMGSQVEATQIPVFDFPWVHKFINFIVLGPRVDATKVEWQNNILVNTVTGDSLTVSENCFNVVPSVAMEKEMAKPDASMLPDAQITPAPTN